MSESELTDLDELVRLLCRWDEAQEAEDAKAVLAQLHDYLTIERLWDLVGKVQAGRTLAEDMRQYEDHLIGVEAALDVYRKATTGRSEGVARERAIYG
jgi:hypothetical protein